VQPRTELEHAVAEAWRDVLGLEQVGVEDDFFEFGGDSLTATQVAARLSRSFALDVSVRDIFDARSVARLAGAVEERLIAEVEAKAGT
jgi:acyl carrier protein